MDLNGDGEGDLPGVISKLPYLQTLGIDAIWLSPFYTSPNRDGGYDVADPRDVDPRFGKLADAEKLIAESHKVGLKVIFDIIPNHFSDQHLWFQSALKSAPGSAERARFHFYDGRGMDGIDPPNNWNSIFGGSSWTRIFESDGKLGQWYLHLFDSSQPDLNWENQDVREDFKTTLRFWFDRGVDGFRIDVAHGLAKDNILRDHPNPDALTKALRVDSQAVTKEDRAHWLSNMPFFDREGVHEIYREWREVIDEYENRMSVAEAFVYPSSRLSRYVRPDELHQVFNFEFLLIDWNAATIKEAASRVIRELSNVGAPPTWALNNHDSPRVVSRLENSEKARALALLTHALPGSLYIYQGEELGLVDGELEPGFRQDPIYFRTFGEDLGRDGCRVPIPWKRDEINFGFSTGTPWLPISKNYENYAVADEEVDSDSFLFFYRKSLALRKFHPALGGEGGIVWHDAPEGVLYFSREPGLIVVANTTDISQTLKAGGAKAILHQSQNNVLLDEAGIHLPANTTVWLQS